MKKFLNDTEIKVEENSEVSKENFFNKELTEGTNETIININSFDNNQATNADINNLSRISENQLESSLFNAETRDLNFNQDNSLTISESSKEAEEFIIKPKDENTELEQNEFNTAETAVDPHQELNIESETNKQELIQLE